MITILTERRLKLLLRAIFIGIVLAFLIICLSSQSNKTILNGRMGGDFPAFYGAAKIIRSGDWQNLYDPQTQRNSQKGLFSEAESSEHLIYAYPPYVALILSPLSWISFVPAYAVYTLCMFLFLLLACKYLKLLQPTLAIKSTDLVMIACIVYPILRAIPGGQNTSLSLFCLLAAAYYLKSGYPVRTGIFLGIWLFKIQLALPALLLFLTSGQFAILLGFIPAAIFYYLLGVVVAGWSWPEWWLQSAVKPFVELDRLANSQNFITVRSFIERLSGQDSSLYLPIAAGICFVLFIALFVFWKKHFIQAPLACLSLASTLLVVLSPHALFYDAGLALIAGVYLCSGEALLWPLLLIAASWLDLASPFLPIQPTFVLLIVMSFLVWQKHNRLNKGKAES